MSGEPLTISWQRNNFKKFWALMKIRVGGQTPVDIMKGDEFEYDGTILKYSGMEIASPSVRGSCRLGWVTDEPIDGSERVSPKVNTRNVAKAQSSGRDLAHVQRGESKAVEMDSLDEETVFEVSDRRPGSEKNPHAQPRVMTQVDNRRANVAGMKIEASAEDVSDQDGVSVGRVKTKASIGSVDITKKENVGLADKLDNTVRGEPKLYKPVGSKTVVKEGVTVRTNVGSVDPSVHQSAEDEGVHVSNVRHSSNKSIEGITVTDTSSIREAKPASIPVKKAEVKIDTNVSPKIRMARRIDPSFPSDWSFTGKLSERLAAVKAHGASPTFLEALYAAEGDQMRRQLEKAFPKQFSND